MELIKLRVSQFTLTIALTFVIPVYIMGQDFPLLYENNFDKGESFSDFEFTDPTVWRTTNISSNNSLELFGMSNYILPVSSPFNIAVLKTIKVGSFVLEVDLKQTGREYPHRDMCLFFNMKDPSNYYYVHISSVADPNAHNIFLVNDEPQTTIASKRNNGVDWGDRWHKVRIERDVKSGGIKVFFDNMDVSIMESSDTHFTSGYIGFGSFDDTGMIDNIKLWGEAVNPGKTFFE